ncbi:MAG: ion channel [Pseudomonadota bacterium]
MMHKEIPLGTTIIILIVLFHAAGLVWLADLLTNISSSFEFLQSKIGAMSLLAFTVFMVIGIHTIEAWIWAFIYLKLGEFKDLSRALYFSVVTCTALGYGDITLSKRWQLLSTFEAMGGLLLFGASTAFLIGFMQKLFVV